MEIIKHSQSRWEHGLKEGQGSVSLGSGSFHGVYTYDSRFEGGSGTNPEELLGAAHAACFTMELASVLEKNRIIPEYIETDAYVHLEKQKGYDISKIELVTHVKDDNLTEEELIKFAEIAKNCIVSRALSVKIELKAMIRKEEEIWRL